MIKDKEYPATHSMSTSWFAVDCEGNIALLNFNENGPVPTIVPEDTIEYIILEQLVDKGSKIKKSILNEEQVNSLVSCLEFKPFTNKNDINLFDCVLRINPQLKEGFMKIFAGNEQKVVVLSEKEGLYLIGCLSCDEENKILNKLCKEPYVLSYAYFDLDCVEEKPDSFLVKLAERCKGIPMYIYAQEYWDPALKQIHSPSCPVKANQLTEENMEVILHLPFSFNDTQQFQIPFHYPSLWSSGENLKFSDDRYTTLKICEKKNPYVRTGRLAISYFFDKYDYESQTYTFEPTIAIVKNEDRKALYMLPNYFFRYAFELNYAERYMYLQDILEYYRPYLLIVMDGVLSSLEKQFRIIGKKIIIGNEEYPIFTSEEVIERKEEILALASRPYRGLKDPIILENEE